jgi:hypothetical protein
MSKIVRRVDFPFIARSVVFLQDHSISGKIPVKRQLDLLYGYQEGYICAPVLRVRICYVLLHAQECGLGRVFPVSHIPELLQIRLDILFGVFAAVTRRSAFFSSTLKFDFRLIAVANVRLL